MNGSSPIGETVRRFAADNSGATAVEYGLVWPSLPSPSSWA